MKPRLSKNRSVCCDEPDHESIHRILVQINRGRNDDSLEKQTEICEERRDVKLNILEHAVLN